MEGDQETPKPSVVNIISPQSWDSYIEQSKSNGTPGRCWPPRVSLGRLLPHARGLRFESLRGGFLSRWESVGFCLIDASPWGFSFKVGICEVLPHRFVDSRLTGTTFWVRVSPWGFPFKVGICGVLPHRCLSVGVFLQGGNM
nr:thioredoxin-like protein CXXS1 [Tanacetum cinerariifolium]